MLFGAVALIDGLVWLPLGQWLAIVAYLFLAWLTEGARLFAEMPYAAVQLPPFPLWVLLGTMRSPEGDDRRHRVEMSRGSPRYSRASL
jgi:hypothetical protein